MCPGPTFSTTLVPGTVARLDPSQCRSATIGQFGGTCYGEGIKQLCECSNGGGGSSL